MPANRPAPLFRGSPAELAERFRLWAREFEGEALKELTPKRFHRAVHDGALCLDGICRRESPAGQDWCGTPTEPDDYPREPEESATTEGGRDVVIVSPLDFDSLDQAFRVALARAVGGRIYSPGPSRCRSRASSSPAATPRRTKSRTAA